MTRSGPPAFVAALALVLLPVAGFAQAEHAHEHSDAKAGAAVAGLKLNNGSRWSTDESLRTGMAAIRKAFDADHPAIHAGRETDPQYDALAAEIERRVNFIVANCKLPAEADAQLHLVVADLLQGVSLMRGQDPAKSRHDGAARVHGALRAYGQFFDDASWPAEPAMKH